MHIFTYGSLMYPEVWQRVVRGSYRSAPASAQGFGRFALTDEAYPGMVARAESAVEGVLYFEVEAHDVMALDAFEGSEYRRDSVTVLLKSGESAIAGTYIFLAEHRLSAVPWQPDAFQMSRFIGLHCPDKWGGASAGEPV
jgi:gamma-glutamylcyclotransferase (GGCT)/AIG2-like uncharacterized protein YtfP